MRKELQPHITDTDEEQRPQGQEVACEKRDSVFPSAPHHPFPDAGTSGRSGRAGNPESFLKEVPLGAGSLHEDPQEGIGHFEKAKVCAEPKAGAQSFQGCRGARPGPVLQHRSPQCPGKCAHFTEEHSEARQRQSLPVVILLCRLSLSTRALLRSTAASATRM